MLFDFSGTLFRLEEDESWYAGLTDAGGTPIDVARQAEIMRRMTTPSALTVDLPAADRKAWETRDLTPALHRQAYIAVLSASGVATVEQATALYSRMIDPFEWTPYPDTGDVLKELAAKDIPVAVVSNIAFDVRPAFARRGWDAYIGAFVLSYEVGVMKPDREIFQIALDRLGAAAPESIMVGDSELADGGVRALGCKFALVDYRPTTAQRPDGLRQALAGIL